MNQNFVVILAIVGLTSELGNTIALHKDLFGLILNLVGTLLLALVNYDLTHTKTIVEKSTISGLENISYIRDIDSEKKRDRNRKLTTMGVMLIIVGFLCQLN